MKTAQKNKTELSQKIAGFLEFLEVEKGNSPLTIRNYKHYLTRFEKFLNSQGKYALQDITQNSVQDYRLFLARFEDNKGHGLSRKTQGFHVISIRSFLKWLIKTDHKVLSPDKIDLPKVPDREVSYLSGEQVDRLLNAPSLSKITGKRDKAILETLYSTGLRVSELAGLDRDKLDFDRREFGVIGKGGKARVVYLSVRATDWIKKYLNSRKDHFSPVFIRHSGKIDPSMGDSQVRLTPRSIQRLVKKYARKIKLPVMVTPHVLRHSFATDLLIAGADLRSVQEMLGHKNIATTQIYTHVTNKHLREVHELFHNKGK